MDNVHDPSSITRRTALRLLLGAASVAMMPTIAMADTQAELDETERQLASVEKQLEQIAADYEALSAEQSATLDAISKVRAQIEETQDDIERKEADLASRQQRLAKRVTSVYKTGGNDLLSILLTASSFEELFSGIYYMDKISEADHRLIDEVKAAKQALAERKMSLERQEADLEALSARQQEQLQAMRNKQDEVQALINSLSDRVKDLIKKRDEELAAAAAEAERARAAAAAAAANRNSYIASPDVLTKGTSGSQAAVISACYSTPTAGAGYCAAWVTNVFVNAGVGSFGGNACDMYNYYCFSADTSELKPGMIVAVSSHPSTVAGRIYGHVGIYVGGGLVMQNVGPITTQSLSDWCAYYGKTVTPRWGWLGGVQLA